MTLEHLEILDRLDEASAASRAANGDGHCLPPAFYSAMSYAAHIERVLRYGPTRRDLANARTACAKLEGEIQRACERLAQYRASI